MQKLIIGFLVLSMNFAAYATSPDPIWYVRDSLMKAIDQSVEAQNLIQEAADQNQSTCVLDKSKVTDETSVSVNYKNNTFTAHFKCSGSIGGLDLNGTFQSDFTVVKSIQALSVEVK